MHLAALICLAAGHILGDFLLQSDWEAGRKTKPSILLKHAGVHALLSYGLLGVWTAIWVPLIIGCSHCLIDLAKAKSGRRDSVRALLADQGAHGLVLLVLTWSAPFLIPESPLFWAEVLGPVYLRALVLIAGFVLTVHAGGVLIKQAVQPYFEQLEAERERKSGQSARSQGLDKGGKIIGMLERSLVFLFLLIGQPSGLGFLVAAKSIFRIAELKDPEERMEAEYIILGTLMSFAYGIAAAYGTMYCLSLLQSAPT